MSETPGSRGLLAATRNSAATLLASGRTRLELLGNEIKEEKLRAVRLLLLSQLMAFCLMVGTLLTIGLLMILFWDSRAYLLGGFIVLSFAAGGFAYVAMRRSMSSDHRMFATTVSELEEDLRHLKGAARNESGTD